MASSSESEDAIAPPKRLSMLSLGFTSDDDDEDNLTLKALVDKICSPSESVWRPDSDHSRDGDVGQSTPFGVNVTHDTPRGTLPSGPVHRLIIDKPADILNGIVEGMRKLEQAQELLVSSVEDTTATIHHDIPILVDKLAPLVVIPMANRVELFRMNAHRVMKGSITMPSSSGRSAAKGPDGVYDGQLASVIRHASRGQDIGWVNKRAC